MSDVFVIAEAGVNHNGSLDMALQLIDVAAEAGADAVKFQTFKSELVISLGAPKAEYQKNTTGNADSQLEMVRKLELSEDDHLQMLEHCRHLGIQFLSTPFDAISADFLVRTMDVPVIKIPSGEITNAPFLLHIARYGRPVILSTGMSTLGEVETALGVLAYGYLGLEGKPTWRAFVDAFSSDAGQQVLAQRVSLLHCTTEYPAPFNQVNLMAMGTLTAAFGLPVGFSDHTNGVSIPIGAVALGAKIIEKHFTLDRSLPGPDHVASLEPSELKAMVEGIRQVSVALGDGRKRPSIDEWPNRLIARRSLVAARPVSQGEIWTEKNLTYKRPGGGVSPLLYWEHLGKGANRNYKADELIDQLQD